MKFDNAEFEGACGTPNQLFDSSLPEVAFAGRSNVGKSSLLNKVFNRKSLARVSSKPGKTVTINFYKLTGARMVDLPGYGYAKVSLSEKQRWSGLLDFYFDSGRDIRLVVQLVDMRHPPTQDDVMMIDYMRSMKYPFIVVMTKCDKLKKTEFAKRLDAIHSELNLPESVACIPFSSETGEGVEQVRQLIAEAVE